MVGTTLRVNRCALMALGRPAGPPLTWSDLALVGQGHTADFNSGIVEIPYVFRFTTIPPASSTKIYLPSRKHFAAEGAYSVPILLSVSVWSSPVPLDNTSPSSL